MNTISLLVPIHMPHSLCQCCSHHLLKYQPTTCEYFVVFETKEIIEKCYLTLELYRNYSFEKLDYAHIEEATHYNVSNLKISLIGF